MNKIILSTMSAISILAITAISNMAYAIERGGTLTFARYDDSNLIDPIYAERNPDIWMVTSLYDTLLRTDADGKSIVPGLAQSFEVAPDGKSITLALRDGIKFSDGSPITGDDAVFSLTRAMSPDLGPWSSLLGSVESVSASGNAITLTLKRPDPTLPAVLATFNTAIVPRAAFMSMPGEKDQDKAQAFFTDGPVGSGPFILKQRERGSTMTFARNPNYWRLGEDGTALPYLDEVKFVVIPDDATRILKLQAGEVQAAEFIPFSRVAELKKDPNIKMELFPSTRIIYNPMNARDTFNDGTKNPLADKRVRQALNYGIDKDVVLQLVTHGIGSPMTSMMSAGTQLHVGTTPLYPYDPVKAKELLKEAGIDKLELTFTTKAGSVDDATMFTAMQQMYAKIGVNLKVEQVDGPTRGEKNNTGNFQIHTYGWVNDINDPAQVVGWLGYFPQQKAVGTGWNNAEFNALFDKSNSEIDLQKRAEQYKRMQEIYTEEAPIQFMYETPFAVALSAKVEGYLQTTLGNNEFVGAWVSK